MTSVRSLCYRSTADFRCCEMQKVIKLLDWADSATHGAWLHKAAHALLCTLPPGRSARLLLHYNRAHRISAANGCFGAHLICSLLCVLTGPLDSFSDNCFSGGKQD